MFPLRDENPTLHTSFATFLIIALNAAAWIFLQGFGMNPELAISVCRFGLIPGELLGIVPPGTQVPMGREISCVIDGSASWLTVFSSMFMHGGWLHLIGNMWFLYLFGDNVEDAMGPVRFVVFYLICGVAAVAAQMISNPASPIPMVGASGAIGGVMGAYVLLYPRAPVHVLVFFGFFITRIVVPAYFMLGFWFLLQVIEGIFTLGAPGGGVAFWAHIGGFLAGVVLVREFCVAGRLKGCRQKRGSTKGIIRRIR
ncbi:MAG TPA: rhomboid family intramembrane serine protease [Deltaproteobacteria bacterium]|nr:rhomboid family intramembrane serine protease [Deltaproteobacteria bacterium]